MQRAAELAVKEINARGGIRGRQLALRVLDDSARPEIAIRIARRNKAVGETFDVGTAVGRELPLDPVHSVAIAFGSLAAIAEAAQRLDGGFVSLKVQAAHECPNILVDSDVLLTGYPGSETARCENACEQ